MGAHTHCHGQRICTLAHRFVYYVPPMAFSSRYFITTDSVGILYCTGLSDTIPAWGVSRYGQWQILVMERPAHPGHCFINRRYHLSDNWLNTRPARTSPAVHTCAWRCLYVPPVISHAALKGWPSGRLFLSGKGNFIDWIRLGRRFEPVPGSHLFFFDLQPPSCGIGGDQKTDSHRVGDKEERLIIPWSQVRALAGQFIIVDPTKNSRIWNPDYRHSPIEFAEQIRPSVQVTLSKRAFNNNAPVKYAPRRDRRSDRPHS